MKCARWAATAALLPALLASEPARASGAETAGDVLQVLLPVAAAGMTLGFRDFEGTRQLTKSLTFTLATTYVLKVSVDAERPNGGGQSFPSGHTAAAFAGASFIQRRYGWRYGLPAYGLASFVAWSRVDAGKHHVRDVAAAAGLAIASTYVLSRPLPDNTRLYAWAEGGSYGLAVHAIW